MNKKTKLVIYNPIKHPLGFTFIELLVVVSLSVIIMLSVTSLFMMFLIGNSKNSTIQTVKSEGTEALNQMTFLLRNAIRVIPNGAGQLCDPNMDSITFISLDSYSTTYLVQTDSDGIDKIASNSGKFITSDSVEVVPNENSQPFFACQSSNDGRSKYITITFTLRKGTPGVDAERDIVEQRFQSGVLLRNN